MTSAEHYRQMIRAMYAEKRGILIAHGHTVAEAKQMAARHCRNVFGEISKEMTAPRAARMRAAINEVLR